MPRVLSWSATFRIALLLRGLLSVVCSAKSVYDGSVTYVGDAADAVR